MSVIGTNELAAAAGVSRQRIGQWAKEGMPRVSRGKWDSEQCLAWIADRRDDTLAATGESSSGDLKDLRGRLWKLQGDAQQMRNHILSANLVLREAAENAYREAIASQIAAGDQWSAGGRSGEENSHRRELWHDLRTVLLGSIEQLAGTLGRGEDVVATRIRYGRRVGG